MKVCFETFGCRLNRAEALQMEADYLAKGWETTTEHKDANLIVIRGCSITRHAQEECEKYIAHLRRHYPSKEIRVCGCLPHTTNLPASKDPKTDAEPIPTRTARAYLKVQDGCAGKCTFCIVPKYRGQSKSIDFVRILDKAKRFVDAGYHEIVVTGCNLALYSSQGKHLHDLLLALADIDSGCRIRLGSVEPEISTMETVRAMSERPNICNFLHLTIQSGSNRILKAMRRPYQIHNVRDIVSEATKLMPDIGLGCDLMTGFPEESDLDFAATTALLKRHPFSNAHVFPYSRRPGTAAAGFPNQIPQVVKTDRARQLIDMAAVARKKFAQSFLGKTVELVVESVQKQSGWTAEYLPCKIEGAAVKRKELVRAKVYNVKDDLLSAYMIKEK